jgi:hypothetical protein
MTNSPLLSDHLRDAVKNCGMTRYEISQRTGIAQSILSRFINHGAGLSLENIDLLCACIGARLVLEPRKNAAKPRKKGRNNG